MTEVYANPWLSVREDDVVRPDGSPGRHAVIDSPDIALVAPWDGVRLHLVEQHRHAIGRWSWEFPSGNQDEPEPVLAAARELREETGLTAGTLEQVGTIDMAPGMLSHRCHVFWATDLSPGEPEREASEAGMRCGAFTPEELEGLIASGELCDAKSLAAYLLVGPRLPGHR